MGKLDNMGSAIINSDVLNTIEINNTTVASLLRISKVGRVLNKEAHDELVNTLTEFFLGNNKERRVFSTSEAYDLIRKAKKATILVAEDLEKVVVNNVVETITQIDKETIENLASIYSAFLPRNGRAIDIVNGKKRYERDGVSKFINGVASEILEKRNGEIVEYTEESLTKLRDVAYVYGVVSKYLPEPIYDEKLGKVVRPADAIISKIAKTKIKDSLEPEKVNMVLGELYSMLSLGDDAFSPEELEKLLKQTTTILTESDICKIQGAKDIIAKYHDKLFYGAESEEFMDLVDQNISLKPLALKAGSFLKNTEETNEEIYDLLTGKTLGKLKSGSVDYSSPEEESRYSSAKIEMLPSQLYHILTQVTSTLSSISGNKVVSMLRDFDELVDRFFDGQQQTRRSKREDFVVDEYLTGNNIVALLQLSNDSAKDRDGQLDKVVENMRSLNAIMSTSAIFEIMRNNMSILVLDNAFLRAELASMVEECAGDRELLNKVVNEFVNTRYPLRSTNPNPLGKKGEIQPVTRSNGVSTAIKDVNDDYSQFEIDIDGGIHKVKTFTDEINSMDIFACLQVLRSYIDKINLAVNDHKTSNVDDMRLTVVKCKKIMSRVDTLIGAMEESEPARAKAFKDMMGEIKTTIFAGIVDKCKDKMNTLGEEYRDFFRGKGYHIDPPESTIASFIATSKKNAKKVQGSDKKSVVYDYLSKFEQEKKDVVAGEYREANGERLDRYNSSMLSLDEYSLYSVTANSIQEHIMGE